MEYKDYYKILDVDRNASEKEVKRTYRRLARKLHPDVNPGDKGAEARFKEINEAYDVLGDPEKRAKYDRLGASWQQWQRAGRDPGGFDWSQSASPGAGATRVNFADLNELLGGAGGSGFSDFFSSLFGGMAGGARPQAQVRPRKGQDLRQPIDITLEEAFRGTTRTLIRDGRRIQASIPAGAKTGTKVRLTGQGTPGSSGGPAGNLYLTITVLPHNRFERKGDRLHTQIPVDFYTAVLGGKTEVETLAGSVQLSIPAGTQGGQVFRLRGKGMPKLRHKDEFGDLYAKVTIQIPKCLSKQEKELFTQLAELRKR